MSGERYAIIVGGERFELDRDQILSDPGNYFATYFLGSFSESARGVRELVIYKEPILFKLIQAHLRGYEILPLADAAIPPYMTRESALLNLLGEAQFYGLSGLAEKIMNFQVAGMEAVSKRNALTSARTYKIQYLRLDEDWPENGYYWATYQISEETYKIYLSRSMKVAHSYISPNPTKVTGYTIQACWSDIEVTHEEEYGGREAPIRCRLLVSDLSL